MPIEGVTYNNNFPLLVSQPVYNVPSTLSTTANLNGTSSRVLFENYAQIQVSDETI